MKIVDNFELIKNHMSFNNPNEFYFLQILQRKKDGNEGLHVRNGYRLIKSYYIYSIKDFDELKPRIIELCHNNNARAYINPNVRNAQEVALECIKRYADLVANNNAFQGNAIWDSACGGTRARGYKGLNIVDIDNIKYLDKYKEIILSCRGDDEDRVVYEVPTVQEFRKRICHILKRYPYLVAEKNGELLGFAYASAFHERAAYDWAVETSIYICMNRRKMGIGRKLHDCLEKLLKEQGILNL